MKEVFKKIILENAVKHKGKANVNFVFGAVLKDYPEWRKDINGLKKLLEPVVKEINSLSLKEQEKQLKEINPSFFKKEERDIFAFLNIKEKDKIITAFPPSPEKYYHIGHAKAILLNYLLAKKFKGDFYLRFEDTNPRNVKQEFYNIMLEDIKWLGVKWKEVVYASDYIDIMKQEAEKLILNSQAYVCFCKPEEMKENRLKKKECECRRKSPQENLIRWKEMDSYEEGKASLRLKIDMKHKNTRMRDPTIFRVIDCEHPRIGYKHRNYPTYDFQNAFLDGYFKITHRFRTVEFEMASELHHYIRKLLGLYDTFTYEIARFNLEGMLSSGRVIREKIEQGELIGWDDPALPTLRALKRRGFTPEAIKQLVIETGITKTSGTKLTWDTLIKYNKRILNDEAKRFFLIKEPVEIVVKNDSKKNYFLPLHPNQDIGKRSFVSNGSYLIEKEDFVSFENGCLVRLMDNVNAVYNKEKNEFVFKSEDYLDFRNYKKAKKIIHFLPNDEKQLVKVNVFMPNHDNLSCFAEKNIQQLKENEIVQFERFGFCRLDKKDTLTFWFTH